MTEDELWKLSFRRLVLWTVKRHRMNPADAEETVQDAIRQFLKAGGKADPTAPKALLDALGSRINGIAVNQRRNKAALAVQLTADGSDAELDDPPDAELEIADREFVRKAISALLVRVEDDELLTALVLQTLDGVEEPTEQARALGRSVQDVYNARRRLKAHLVAVQQIAETW